MDQRQCEGSNLVKSLKLGGYTDNVFGSEYTEEFIANSCYFDQNWVDQQLIKIKTVFETNPEITYFGIDKAPTFYLYKGIQEDDGDEHYPFDWASSYWRFDTTHITKYGEIWLKFYQKHSDQIMEVKLK